MSVEEGLRYVDKQGQHSFSNENISVQCTYKPGCLVDMSVSVTSQATEAAYRRAMKNVKKEVSLPGFRKGHVPESMLLKHFKNDVDRQSHNVLADTSFREAIQLVGRDPFHENSVRAKVVRFSAEEGSELWFEYEARPIVPTIDIDSLSLECIEPTMPKQEKIENLYMQLKLFQATERNTVDRPVQDGDFVTVMLFYEDGSSEEQAHLFFQQGYLPSQLYDALLGMKAGDEKEISFQDDEGRRVQKCSISSVLECSLPEENEEFFEKVKVSSAEAAKDQVRKMLEFEARVDAYEKMRHQFLNECLKLYAFDLPQSLVKGETEARIRGFLETVSEAERGKFDKEKLRKDFGEEVKRYFTLSYLLQPLFSVVDTSCTSNELQEEMYRQHCLPHPQRVVFSGLDEETTAYRLLLQVFSRQCEAYCLKKRLGVEPPRAEVRSAKEPEESAAERDEALSSQQVQRDLPDIAE